MAWEIVAAGLGGAVIGVLGSLAVGHQQANIAKDRLKTEHLQELRREEIKRRTDIRREYLDPLRISIGRMIVLSNRFQQAVGRDTSLRVNMGLDPAPFSFDDVQEAARALERFRVEELGPKPWWGVADKQLGDSLCQLLSDLRDIEQVDVEMLEYEAVTATTDERASSASANLDNTLASISERLEYLMSGADLVSGYAV